MSRLFIAFVCFVTLSTGSQACTYARGAFLKTLESWSTTCGHPLCGCCSVDRPMIHRESNADNRAYLQLPLGHDGLLVRRPHCEYRGLVRVDDRREVRSAEHPQAGDGQDAALQLVLPQLR